MVGMNSLVVFVTRRPEDSLWRVDYGFDWAAISASFLARVHFLSCRSRFSYTKGDILRLSDVSDSSAQRKM
jgi:hypothetical protein